MSATSTSGTSAPSGAPAFVREGQRRRTFAIISHPDSGKTTLTEKLLLYAQAIHLAGSVKARKASRHAVSDWMQMEQERGISVTSSVMQFDHLGSALNLLDTPGHADFSEDTYRTLAAVDSALMLMDHAKGVEARTKKLFEVCRMRQLPVITFMNKLDREGLEPLALIDQVGDELGLKVAPLTWPVGMGRDFRGVVDIPGQELVLYSAKAHGTETLETERHPWDSEAAREALGSALYETVQEELELLELAGVPYDHEAFLNGDLSPVFWGSAMTNFGVGELLGFLAREASPPRPRLLEMEGVSAADAQSAQAAALMGDEAAVVRPDDQRFSGFVFKIQANMNPKHRDRIAFMRVVSGTFRKGMDAVVGRTGLPIKMAKPHMFLAKERATVEEAYPGDIVGLYDPGKLRVGDTLAQGRALKFHGIPRFAPEHFGQLVLEDPLKRKALDAGLEQLAHEGVVQLFYHPERGRTQPTLGAVGVLQFEVLKERLKNEYKVNARFERLGYACARWVGGRDGDSGEEALKWIKARRDYTLVSDRFDRPVLLAKTAWSLQYVLDNAPKVQLFDIEPLE